jgi:hypothetical protein
MPVVSWYRLPVPGDLHDGRPAGPAKRAPGQPLRFRPALRVAREPQTLLPFSRSYMSGPSRSRSFGGSVGCGMA